MANCCCCFGFVFDALPEDDQDQADSTELDKRAEEVTNDMGGRGYVPVTLEDMMPNPGRIDASEMRREGGAGTVSLPPTIYTAPIVLSLTATPSERRDAVKTFLLLGPVWLALGVS
eukprot:7388843-Prymnesium_polylepis.1